VEPYENVIVEVQKLLSADTEWKVRYNEYIDTILRKAEMAPFKKAQEQFAVPAPFQLYMPLSTVVNDCSGTRTVFELRFHGQSVAVLIVSNKKDKEVAIRVKRTQAIYDVLRSAKMEKEATYLENLVMKTEASSEYDWHGEEAKSFRKIYSDLEHALKNNAQLRLAGQPEHEMESELLHNYAQKSSVDKEVSFIQPVMMYDTRARFQMPTPIRASDVKNGIDKLSYSRSNGGGIDILARVGSGRSTYLAVLELKDENTKSEPPHKVVCQAIAYATFLHELIRSECGQKWWGFFGFGGSIPKNLSLKAVITMPYKNKNRIVDESTTKFIDFINESESNRIIKIPGTNDSIELGYIFRDTPNGVIKNF